jgi:hypothetical protein
MAKEPSEKRRPYLVRVLLKTSEELEAVQIISDFGGATMIAMLAWHWGFAQQSEMPELIFLGAAGIGGAFIGFAFRFIFVTPAKLFNEMQQEIASKGDEIQAIKNSKPQLIMQSAFPDNGVDESCFCRIAVKNKSVTGTANLVKIELIGIDPSPEPEFYSLFGSDPRRNYGLETVDVPYPLSLRPTDPDGRTIHPGCVSKFDVFAVKRPTTQYVKGHQGENVFLSLTVYFMGVPRLIDDVPGVPKFEIGHFKPQLADKQKPEAGFREYYITLRMSAQDVPAVEKRFTVFFVRDLSQYAVQIS